MLGRGPRMTWVRWSLRFASVVSMAIWVGGLPVYGALVLPRLHRAIGVPRTAPITREVTHGLNLIGLVALAAWAVMMAWDRWDGRLRPRRAAAVLWSLSALTLLGLWTLHSAMSAQMEAGRTSTAGFYPLHRVYLIAGLIQWCANLALLGVAIAAWGVGGGRRDHPVSSLTTHSGSEPGPSGIPPFFAQPPGPSSPRSMADAP